MRTMASVLLLLVLLTIQDALGNYNTCENIDDIKSCDDCAKCGGTWCSKNFVGKCILASEASDDYCNDGLEETVSEKDQKTTRGTELDPVYIFKTLNVLESSPVTVLYNTTIPNSKITWEVFESTQTKEIHIYKKESVCSKNGEHFACKLEMITKPSDKFCTKSGGYEEFATVKIHIENIKEELEVKYHVPCACECTANVKTASSNCTGNGDFLCGVCDCYQNWSGKTCNVQKNGGNAGGGINIEGSVNIKGGINIDGGVKMPNVPIEVPSRPHGTGERKCPPKRGDTPQCDPRDPHACNGNGYCDKICETCFCYDNKEGYQYFDETNLCSDLCMATIDCEQCIANRSLGECSTCEDYSMVLQAYNETLRNDQDAYGRKFWVGCNATVNECTYQYVAMKSLEDGTVYVMVENNCDPVTEASTAVKVPIIMGVLGLIAAVAAVGGIMLWKHMNSLPPVNPNTPGYTNIDAEECVGENPLYKCPTSSYKNPMFGKL